MKRLCDPFSAVVRALTAAAGERYYGVGRICALLLFMCAATCGMAGTVTLTTGTKGQTTYTQGGVTVAFPDGSASNSDFVKFTKGQSFIVTASSGSLTQIVITYASSKNSKPENITASAGSISNTTTASTWSGSATTVTFTNTTNSAADVFIASLTVTLEGAVAPVLPTKASSFVVAKGTTYVAQQELWNDAKTARAVLGGWLFPNTIKPTAGASDDEFGKDGNWGSTREPKETASEYVKDFPYYIDEGNNKNARQEDGSNAQPMSTKVWKNTSNGSYNYMDEVTTTADAMFNVPCNGSYLVFTAEVPGTIKAVVYQNGAFDQSSNKNQYRPQRRVFILDEAGQIVPSTPKLENTAGKPKSTKLSDYTWDFGTMPTTDAAVQEHFVGLTNFKMSSFQNGVYESKLSYDVCRNEVLNDATLKDVTGKGYRGWSVLSDAPVSYTFSVKPGKTYYVYNYGSRIGFYGFTFTPQTNLTVDEVSYSENDATVTATAEGHTATVSLDRVFKGGVWNAAVLPFSLNKQQVDEIFGATYSKDNAEGTQILYFDYTEGTTIYFQRHAYNTIVAGKPFLIKPAKTGDIKINTSELTESPYRYVTIESTEAEDFGLNKEKADYCWAASYQGQDVAAGDYFIRDFEANNKAADGKVVRVPVTYASAFSIGGFRGYLKAKDETTRKNAKSMTIGINDINSSETTYIENVVIDTDGTLRPAQSGRVYNLQGQPVGSDASALSTLPKGVYIVNGKKVIIK